MRYLIPTYCVSSFFDHFATRQIDLLEFEKEGSLQAAKAHVELAQFLFKGADVYTDMPFDEVRKTSNPFLKFLYKNSRLRFLERPLNRELFDAAEVAPFSVFLLDSSVEECKKIERQYGYYCMPYSDETRISRLFRFQVETFNVNTNKSWAFTRNYAEPLNSLLICDPHLFQGNKRSAGLTSMLSELLSASSDAEVDISFVTTCKNFGVKKADETFDWNEAEARFRDFWTTEKVRILNHIGDNVNLSVILYKGGEFHDRYIITNNLMIYSGYSFDGLLDPRSGMPKKQTSWIIIRHCKVLDSNITNEEKIHFHTVTAYLQNIQQWIASGKAEIISEAKDGVPNRLLRNKKNTEIGVVTMACAT